MPRFRDIYGPFSDRKRRRFDRPRIDRARLIYAAPFVIDSVENNKSFMSNLPDPLYIGEYE
jgi:hypothetical protein